MKSPMTSSGIEPEIFRLVTTKYATACPTYYYYNSSSSNNNNNKVEIMIDNYNGYIGSEYIPLALWVNVSSV
jgi:hypothetical protein